MPDLDILPRTTAPGWRAADRIIEGGGSDDEVAKELLAALSQSLRDGGGLLALDSLAAVVSAFATGQLTHAQAMSEVRRIVRDSDGHRNAKVAERTVGHILVELANNELPRGDLRITLAERFLWCLVDHSLFGRRRPEWVGSRYADLDEAINVEERYRSILGPQLVKLAEKLARNPSASNLS